MVGLPGLLQEECLTACVDTSTQPMKGDYCGTSAHIKTVVVLDASKLATSSPS